MEKKDWFRKETWTPQDRKDFFDHLRRARDYNKAQYLRIQAHHLSSTYKDENIKAALELLNLMVTEYPHPIELERAYHQIAECFEKLGSLDQAVDAYRKAFEARRSKPNVRSNAPLDFGIMIVRNERNDLYDEVLEIFQELVSANDIIFPSEKYKFNSVMAIIADHYEKKSVAYECAQRAISAANQSFSGFRYHPTVGLVENADQLIMKRLWKIKDI